MSAVAHSQPAYSADSVGLASAATATDIFTITGSATRTIKVTKVTASGRQTTAGQVLIILLKRSTANAGATTNETEVPHDSNDAAASATVRSYTANPTPGTLVGRVASTEILVPAAATAADGGKVVFDFSDAPVVLRGTGEVLALNLNSVTVTGGSFNCSVMWTEE